MDNGDWVKYKAMFLEDRQENKDEHAEIRRDLGEIKTALVRLEGEHRLGKYFGTTFIAGVVSAIMIYLSHILKGS